MKSDLKGGGLPSLILQHSHDAVTIHDTTET